VTRLDAAIAAIGDETGWRARTLAEGGAEFALEDFTFRLQAPDDRHLSLLYRLATLPAGEDAGPRARTLAHMAAASAHTRTSALSFDGEAFWLHADADLTSVEAAEIPALTRDFLNDCDWWRMNAPPL
jgi:hypothetical protein